ncbi:molecular chaperone DjiA [Campylobacter gracilis]|uniref:DnaJ domain protein n=1 Tax=Campylobacter gracilis RM3268 TaxID=553220 RepID=C8PLB9_9BACT|nr:molecular chaperone DjiA [Campylobacter gracilis]AKT92846.1 DnaJ-like membrane chaperone protein (N-terminal terB-like domain) [Campylobacter gracilis]EEV16231.1 DnaJ domain protein [Campylobacter gracilis RM3268]UEB44984.1 molecular chaperone DjiA [Campylobacter gracilis]SUW78827.1 DnaJ domain-containing protein [Campylobacter gracilis]
MLSIIFLLIALYIFAQIGVAFGNSGYRGKAQMQLAEAKILVALLAKVAKSDGHVSESEAAMISEILDDLVRQMGAGEREREALKLVYKLEKENFANVRELAEKYNQIYRPSPSRKTGLIYFFLNLAYVDRGFSAAERRTISQICDGLGIAEHIQSQIFATFERSFYGTYYENGGAQSSSAYDEYDGYSTRSGGYWDKYGGRSTGGYGSSSYGGGTGYGYGGTAGSGYGGSQSSSGYGGYSSGYSDGYSGSSQGSAKSKRDPYEILGLSKDATFSEIKKKYRELVKKYHPDILMGKGADEEIIQEGTKKLQEINEAYKILKERFGEK